MDTAINSSLRELEDFLARARAAGYLVHEVAIGDVRVVLTDVKAQNQSAPSSEEKPERRPSNVYEEYGADLIGEEQEAEE